MWGSARRGDWPGHREIARPDAERLLTSPTVVTLARTVVALALVLWGAREQSLPLLLAGLGVYWVGDVADGLLARMLDQETRTGAVLDIMCDRLSAAGFYLGFAWYAPAMAFPVGVYLFEFLVPDTILSLAFLAWPISSPNYFYLVDPRIWRWNWSKLGKAANSALFAVLMVVTRDPWLASGVALALLVSKIVSLGWLRRIGLPVPVATPDPESEAEGEGDPSRLVMRQGSPRFPRR